MTFSAIHPDSAKALQAWRKIIEARDFRNFADLKSVFNSVDKKTGEYTVFDICGNRFRIVAAIHFDRQKLFIREVFTHQEYDKWKP